MSDDELKDGLYETVISEAFGQQLSDALAQQKIWATMTTVDPQEAVRYLADYVRHLVQCCLKDIADTDSEETLQNELTLTNDLIRLLTAKIQEMGQGHQVKQSEFLLTELFHRQNRPVRPKVIRPDTPLTKSFLFTNSQKDISLVSELRKEIASSDRIDFLVSFIKFSGLSMIYPYLKQFTDKGGILRIITTTYMGATDPKAICELARLPNTEVHVSYNVKETRLHAKSYIFHRNSGYSTAYIGSSNLSHAAIADGLEWNIKVTQQDMPGILDKMTATFEAYWHSPEFQRFTLDQRAELQQAIDFERGRDLQNPNLPYTFTIRPYPYQQVILDALQVERKERNRWHNLIVAATGTGKTAIAAFDYRQFASRRPTGTKLLFIAHRKEILEQALSCFRQVLRDPDFGALNVGGQRAVNPEHVFLSIQSFESQKLWEMMDPAYYDIIIVDEFHHAAAKSYQKLLSYFHPQILLGMTATPERMDGKDILRYFDYHIAAEIRLADAIERRLLCPFHYFGVADTVDLSAVKWTNGHYDVGELTNLFALENISAKRRADAVLQAIDRYTADLREIKGLGFCVSQEHARFMADYFNAKNVPSLALDANTPNREREQARHLLETGQVTFLFVVDLFNEGVDIPAVNTVLFLRPTNSMTVFLQQLGRGLRLAEHKDCLTVLDFVAQSNRKYDFTSRLQSMLGSGSVVMRKEIQNGFPHVPKGCSIQLEEVAQQRILDNINARLRRNDFYKEIVSELYYAADHHVPTLQEFLKAAAVEPRTFYNGTRTYTRLCAEAGVIPDFAVTAEEEQLRRAIPRMLSIDSPSWLTFLRKAFAQLPTVLSETEQQYLRMWQFTVWGKDYAQAGFATPLEAIRKLAHLGPLTQEICQVLEGQYDSFSVIPKDPVLPYPCALEVYCNYSRDQIFAALGVNRPDSVREGVKYLDDKKTDVFLVTLNKSEKEFSDTTLYEDYSINEWLFHWQSQSTTTSTSKTGQRYIHQNETGNTVLLFVRERKKETNNVAMSFTFLGKAHIVRWSGSQPMTILYKLDNPIPAKYITTTDSSGVL